MTAGISGIGRLVLRPLPASEMRHRAVTALVEREAMALLDYFLRRTSTSDDAADLLGDTLVVIWRREHSIPDDPTRARMWMFGVARKVLAGQRRSNRRRAALTERLADELRSRPAPPPEDDTLQLRTALEALSETDQEIMRLVYWDGFSLAEVAELLHIPAATARSRHARASAKLRDLMAIDEGQMNPEIASTSRKLL